MSDQQFKKAAEVIQSLPKNAPVKVSQDTQLKVYALYKQATTGDVNTSRPGMLDMTGRYKWDAWNKLKGKSSEDAKKEYVQTFFEIFEPHKGRLIHSDADDAEYAKYLEEVQSLA